VEESAKMAIAAAKKQKPGKMNLTWEPLCSNGANKFSGTQMPSR
jgi:hypothetical protein